MQPVTAVIVGMGSISSEMLPLLRTKPWYRTVGVVDVRDEALAKAGAELSLPDNVLYRDLGAALAKCPANTVLINTPSELHYEQAQAALQAGKHVLVAKPITNDYQHAVELVELAKRQGVTLAVGQQIRYNRHYTTVRRVLETGRLGSVEVVFFFNAKPRHKALNLATMSQPALYEMSCHHFDSLLSLFPDRAPESITIDGFRPSWSVYAGLCMINGLITLEGGVHVLYHGGFSVQADMYELRLEGSQGALRCRGIHMSNDTMDYEYAERGGKWQPVTIDADIPAQNPFLPFLDTWHDYLSGGPEPPFSGRNNLKVFAMLSAGGESIRVKGPVTIRDNARYREAFE